MSFTQLTELKLVDNGQPKYQQLADRIEELIRSAQLTAAFRIPSERKLAQQLGVSVITISNTMQELVQRNLVERKVGSGTYVRNLQSEQPKTRRIGFFRHYIPPNYKQKDRYSREMLGTMLAFWQNTNYDFVAMQRQSSEYQSTIAEYKLDGIIIYSPRQEFIAEIKALADSGYPVVALSSVFPEISTIGHGYSNSEIIGQAVRYLVNFGHRDIAMLIPQLTEAAYCLRHQAFMQSMYDEKIPVNPAWSTPLHNAEAEIYAMLSEPKRPSAVILGSCGYTERFYQIAAQLNLHIPEQISVLSIDEDDSTFQQSPVPSAFRVDVVRMTIEASEYLLNMLENQDYNKDINSNYEFIERESCKKIKLQ